MCLQLTLMLLKVKDTSVMLREGGTPGGSNLGSSSVMVAPRPTGPRSLTVTPIGSSQHLWCCENEVKLHGLCLLKMVQPCFSPGKCMPRVHCTREKISRTTKLFVLAMRTF